MHPNFHKYIVRAVAQNDDSLTLASTDSLDEANRLALEYKPAAKATFIYIRADLVPTEPKPKTQWRALLTFRQYDGDVYQITNQEIGPFRDHETARRISLTTMDFITERFGGRGFDIIATQYECEIV